MFNRPTPRRLGLCGAVLTAVSLGGCGAPKPQFNYPTPKTAVSRNTYEIGAKITGLDGRTKRVTDNYNLVWTYDGKKWTQKGVTKNGMTTTETKDAATGVTLLRPVLRIRTIPEIKELERGLTRDAEGSLEKFNKGL